MHAGGRTAAATAMAVPQCSPMTTAVATVASIGACIGAAVPQSYGIAGTHMLVVHPTRIAGAVAPMPVRIGVMVAVRACVCRMIEVGDRHDDRRGGIGPMQAIE